MTVRLLALSALLALPRLRSGCDKPPPDQPHAESYKKRVTTSDVLAAFGR